MSSGWIKLPRDIVNHWLWLDAQRLQWWLDLLLMAAWEERTYSSKNIEIELQRGQLAVTIRFLAKRWGTYTVAVSSFLKSLENYGMISRNFDCKFTVINILHYDDFCSPQKIAKKRNSYSELKQFSNTKIKIKNIKENSILERNNAEKLFLEFKSHKNFKEDCLDILNISGDEFENFVRKFHLSLLDTDNYPQNFSDFKRYFINWASAKQKNYSNVKTKNSANAKQKTNRGSEPSNFDAKDGEYEF